jgi:hypothetical protein
MRQLRELRAEEANVPGSRSAPYRAETTPTRYLGRQLAWQPSSKPCLLLETSPGWGHRRVSREDGESARLAILPQDGRNED